MQSEHTGTAHRSSRSHAWCAAIVPSTIGVLVAPAGLWALAWLFVPITAPQLSPIERWGLALAILMLVGLSLAGHVQAHTVAARCMGGLLPTCIRLYPFGDLAQTWPAAPTPWREALAALAGPFASLLFGGLAYLIWNYQLHPYLDTCMLFLSPFNVAVAIANLAPGLPLDGGRLVRAIVWGLLHQPARAERLGRRLGALLGLGLALWGSYLIAQRVRFSLETGAGTIAFAALLLLGLRQHPTWDWEPSPAHRHLLPASAVIRTLAAGLCLLVLLATALSLVPTVQGLHAPGPALPVEPMVYVAPEHRHVPEGTFLLTSVIAQTPIVAGQWVYAQLDPAIEIVPPEQIVPPDITPQEQVEQSFQMLQESEAVAIVVGLRLAGYQARVTSTAIEIVAVLPESPGHSILQPGDRILRLNEAPIATVDELIARVRALDPKVPAGLLIERDGRQLHVDVPLMPPVEPGDPPRLGVRVQGVGLNVELPFPVRIEPQKIGGGPSAGLIFALTVYNLVTPGDLTGGYRIAGTGTIALDGTVGPIGGVMQKVASAEQAGAEYFLVPPANYSDARRAARRINVVEVANVQEAIAFLRHLPAPRGRS